MKRRVVVLERDMQLQMWCFWFEGYIVAETERWIKVKRSWWRPATWLPKHGIAVNIQELT